MSALFSRRESHTAVEYVKQYFLTAKVADNKTKRRLDRIIHVGYIYQLKTFVFGRFY